MGRINNGSYAPKFLSPGAREIWKRLRGAMSDAGILKSLDHDLFNIYCQTIDQYEKATIQFVEGGERMMVDGANGEIINPLLRLQSSLNKDIMSMGNKLGISAASRASKGLAAGVEADRKKQSSTFGDLD